MSNQSRGDPAMNMNSASSLPLHEDSDACTDPMSWLWQIDITEYDYPYIKTLLISGYNDWRKLTGEIFDLDVIRFFIASHKGEIIDADPGIKEFGSGEHGDERTLQEAISGCMAEHRVTAAAYSGGSLLVVPVYTRHRRELFALFGCSINGYDYSAAPILASSAARHFRTCFYNRLEALLISDLLQAQQKAKREEHRRSMLFQIVQKFHDKIDVDSVISEIFETVAGMYPEAKLELFMSQDHHSRDPRVKSLQLQAEGNNLCVSAFTEGRLLRKEQQGANGNADLEVAVPLMGKQGVYGVFHLLIGRNVIYEVDIQLIGMLADTAGTAFENAKLYEQSNLLIGELRLINELTKRLNQSLRLKEVFKFATEELLSIFKAEYCCISQSNKENGMFEIMSGNLPGLANQYFPIDYGFSGLVYSTQEPFILQDYQTYGKVTSKMMEDTGARSLIAAPLMVSGEVNGAIILAHRQSRFFSYDNFKLLQLLASHIGLAIANASLHAEVRKMANRDMLTGLYARHYVDDVIQEFQKKDAAGSLIIVDIDQFKQVNDTFGHQTGDKILKQVCSIVRSSIRKSDIAARWGGEELAVYLPGANADNGYEIAETIRLRVAMDTDPAVTVSCGVSDWVETDDKIDVESLFYQADMALYKAKNNGRNQTQIAGHSRI